MTGDHLARLFADLEQQAEGLQLVERDLEVAERGRAEYAEVGLADRVHASVRREVTVEVLGGPSLRGELSRAGRDWLQLSLSGGPEWWVRLAALRQVRGLSAQAVVEAARPAVARLGFGSVLRGLAADQRPVRLSCVDAQELRGHVARVGEDFLELVDGTGDRAGPVPSGRGLAVVPFAAVGAVRREPGL